MLENPKAYLVRARREGWALGGFNVFNLESARAVVDAAEQAAAPVLLQTSEGAVKHAGLDNMVAMVRQLTSRTKAPVALHLDHGKSEALARAAVDAGYTSVMIDASRQTFEENLRETRAIVDYAHARGVHVEAELGMLGGIEDLGEQAGRSMLPTPTRRLASPPRRRSMPWPSPSARRTAPTSSAALRASISRACKRSRRVSRSPSCCMVPHRCRRTRSALPSATAPSCRTRRASPPSSSARRDHGHRQVNTDPTCACGARRLRPLRRTAGLLNLYELMGEVEAAIRDSVAARSGCWQRRESVTAT